MSTDALVVVTCSGRVRGDGTSGRGRGSATGEVRVWRGIPYAAAPVGALRFRAPQRREPWDGIRECVEFGPSAPQSASPSVPADLASAADEDCLSVNVWAPWPGRGDARPPDDASRPVMVWIHGGAYCLGSSAQPVYDGARLAWTHGVVVVSFNYRLGALGFTDLSSFGPDFDTNCGLRDQIAALEWVRDNIAAFGGDPASVTVFGESSGASAITTLMTVPSARGLFHRAIAQSPPATSVYGARRAGSVARRFLDVLGVEPDRADVLLRAVPVADLVAASDTVVDEVPTGTPGTLAMAPVVDHTLVPRYPVAAFQQGLSHPVPLVIGSNRDESSIFKFMKSPLLPVTGESVDAMLAALADDHPDLPRERIVQILAAYPGAPAARRALGVSRDAAFRMPALWVADAHSARAPTWMYRFDHATPMLRAARIGAGHATEVPYVFGNFGTLHVDPTFWLGGRRSAGEVSRRVGKRWTAFARRGVPASLDGSKHWARYDSRERATLVIDTRDSIVRDPDRELRVAWGDQALGFQ
ncbi:carboxylesterase/lipase family protein [Rhodococcus sp. HNM0569]|uniref:carboxylesterase/lipase family protein n=1 Tax=Rhodococcus sp. HNM0569 TaxID=2716340 RepID=UPI00146EDFE2|nr:carboxylesterase/lipase family protein [Rhodococcus sp. HNM0569]NLU84409.1 carboxylesterase/lipase family protein [Rhodococcus sp. HNM0569]